MNAMTVAQRMTAQEFLAHGFDGVRSELVAGEVVVPALTISHQRVLRDIWRLLDAWTLAAPGRGEVTFPIDILIDEHNVFGPDLLWYAEGRSPSRPEEPPYPMPDLAVEVRSPSTSRSSWAGTTC